MNCFLLMTCHLFSCTSVKIEIHSILSQYIASNSAKSKENLQGSVIAKVVEIKKCNGTGLLFLSALFVLRIPTSFYEKILRCGSQLENFIL